MSLVLDQTNILSNHVEAYGMQPEDFMNPEYIVPLLPEEELHVGYTPLSEESAFRYPISSTQHIFVDHFHVSRENMPLEQVISCIRKMVMYPTNNAVVYIDNCRDAQYDNLLYRTTCIVHEYTREGDEVYANVLVSVSADSEHDSYLIEVNRYSGNREVFHRFYETFQYYMETGGTQNMSVRVHCGPFDPSRLGVFAQLDSNFD